MGGWRAITAWRSGSKRGLPPPSHPLQRQTRNNTKSMQNYTKRSVTKTEPLPQRVPTDPRTTKLDPITDASTLCALCSMSALLTLYHLLCIVLTVHTERSSCNIHNVNDTYIYVFAHSKHTLCTVSVWSLCTLRLSCTLFIRCIQCMLHTKYSHLKTLQT